MVGRILWKPHNSYEDACSVASVVRRPASILGRGLLRRVAWAMNRLRSGLPLKATDLARAFEVSVRTAYRDLDFLRDEWRVPLEFDRSRGT